MKAAIAIVLFWFGCACASALADTRADQKSSFSDTTRALWKMVNLPGEPWLPTLMTGLETLIPLPEKMSESDRFACRSKARELTYDLTVNTVSSSRQSPLEGIADKFPWFKQMSLPQPAGSCQEYLSRVYLLTSLAVSHQYATPVRVKNTELGVDDSLIGLMLEYWLDVPRRPAVLLLTAALINSGRIRLLDTSARAELVATTGNRAWSEKKDAKSPTTNPYRVLGAYFCADSTIWVDPFIQPLDLASTFLHELDHWMRDRDSRDVTKLAKAQALFDETVAMTASSIRQVNVLAVWRQYLSRDTSLTRTIAQVCQDPLLDKRTDLTWFGKSGPTCSMDGSADIIGEVSLGNESAILMRAMRQRQDENQPIERIMRIVASRYFPKSDPNALAKSLQWDEASLKQALPLSAWLADYEDFFRMQTKFPALEDFDGFIMPPKVVTAMPHGKRFYLYGIRYRMLELLVDIHSRLEKPNVPSASCQAAAAAYARGELDDYLGGNKLGESGAGARPGESGAGARPGESGAGARPGESGAGARPGESGAGARPGESGAGARPGESGAGARPTIAPGLARPCSPVEFQL